MFRALTALGALALLATVASAQPGSRLPLSPGVMPASPFGPGMPFRPAITSPGQQGFVLVPVLSPYGYPVSPFFGTGFGYPYGGVFAPPISVTQSVVTELPQRADPNVVLVKEFPATLTVQFPGTAEVWLDGKKVEGTAAEERVLKSPVLKPGETYTFLVKGRWTTGGKTYEAKRELTLSPGDRSRLFIVSGEEVK